MTPPSYSGRRLLVDEAGRAGGLESLICTVLMYFSTICRVIDSLFWGESLLFVCVRGYQMKLVTR